MPNPPTEPPFPRPPGAAHILVIEDEPDLLDALTDLLADEGYAVSGASNGADALNFLADRPAPDLILLDLMMPVMNGFDFREAQCRDPRLQAIPTVALTASPDSRVRALDVPAWLAKPLSIDALLDTIERHRLHRGAAVPDHSCQFYSDRTTLARDTAAYLLPALADQGAALVFATRASWRAIRAQLAAAGADPDACEADGRLVHRDAEDEVDRLLMPDGGLSDAQFLERIGGTVTRTLERCGRIRVYGEIVDLLSQEGRLDQALWLESAWNRLLGTSAYPLRCAYYLPDAAGLTDPAQVQRHPTAGRVRAHHACMAPPAVEETVAAAMP